MEVYYASEIDQDAIMVTRCNHGGAVTQIGDVTKLDYKQVDMLPTL